MQSQTNGPWFTFLCRYVKKKKKDWGIGKETKSERTCVCEREKFLSSMPGSRWPPVYWTWQLTTIIIQHKWSTLFDICQGNLVGEIALCPSLALSLSFCLFFCLTSSLSFPPSCICLCLSHSSLLTPYLDGVKELPAACCSICLSEARWKVLSIALICVWVPGEKN